MVREGCRQRCTPRHSTRRMACRQGHNRVSHRIAPPGPREHTCDVGVRARARRRGWLQGAGGRPAHAAAQASLARWKQYRRTRRHQRPPDDIRSGGGGGRRRVHGSAGRCGGAAALVAERRNTLASSTRCEGHSVSGSRRMTMTAQGQVHIPCGHRASMLMCREGARFPCGCEIPSRQAARCRTEDRPAGNS